MKNVVIYFAFLLTLPFVFPNTSVSQISIQGFVIIIGNEPHLQTALKQVNGSITILSGKKAMQLRRRQGELIEVRGIYKNAGVQQEMLIISWKRIRKIEN